MYEVIWLTRTDLADALINWQGFFSEKQDAHAAAGSLPWIWKHLVFHESVELSEGYFYIENVSRGLCFAMVWAVEKCNSDMFLGRSLSQERLRGRNLLDLMHLDKLTTT